MSDSRYHVAQIKSEAKGWLHELNSARRGRDSIYQHIGALMASVRTILCEIENKNSSLPDYPTRLQAALNALHSEPDGNEHSFGALGGEVGETQTHGRDLKPLTYTVDCARLPETNKSTASPVNSGAGSDPNSHVSQDFANGLSFRVSQDEEHTRLRWSDGRQQADLGERVHHYCLLTMARLRVSDARRGLDQEAQGWVEVEQLATMLGIDPGHLNIQIFRSRRQLQRVLRGYRRSPALIERRRGSVRIGAHPVQIWRGTKLEAFFDPSEVRPD